jgi:hypothetical protein
MIADPLSSLDCEQEIQYVFLCSEDNPTTPFKILVDDANRSPFLRALIANDSRVINSVENPVAIPRSKYDHLKFVVDYLNIYSSKDETDPPKHLVSSYTRLTDLVNMMDFHLFDCICSQMNRTQRMKMLGDLLELTFFLGLDTLCKKLGAIYAFYIHTKNLSV